jgi:hypothetical protein
MIDGSRRTRRELHFINVDTIIGRPPEKGKTQYNPVISKKDPERNTECNQVPPGVHLAADEESAQGGRRTTTGEEPLGVAQRVETAAAVK